MFQSLEGAFDAASGAPPNGNMGLCETSFRNDEVGLPSLVPDVLRFKACRDSSKFSRSCKINFLGVPEMGVQATWRFRRIRRTQSKTQPLADFRLSFLSLLYTFLGQVCHSMDRVLWGWPASCNPQKEVWGGEVRCPEKIFANLLVTDRPMWTMPCIPSSYRA